MTVLFTLFSRKKVRSLWLNGFISVFLLLSVYVFFRSGCCSFVCFLVVARV